MNVGNNTHFNGIQYNGYSSFHDGKQIKANTIIESEIQNLNKVQFWNNVQFKSKLIVSHSEKLSRVMIIA